MCAYELPEDIVEVLVTPSGTVWNTGVMRHGECYSIDTNYDGEPITLGDSSQNEGEDLKVLLCDPSKNSKVPIFARTKRSRRTSADGHTYIYSGGGMSQLTT